MGQIEVQNESILEGGGQVFDIHESGEKVGRCTILPFSDNALELAELNVVEQKRGRGRGGVLLKAALAWSRTKNVDGVVTFANTNSEAFVALCLKYGFQVVSVGPVPERPDCNIQLALYLKDD